MEGSELEYPPIAVAREYLSGRETVQAEVTVPEISLCYGGVSCSADGEHALVYHEVRRMAAVDRPQGLVTYADVEEGGWDELRVEGEVLRAHCECNSPVVRWAQKVNGDPPHMLGQKLVVHCWRIELEIILEEVNGGCASVNPSLLYDHLPFMRSSEPVG